MNATLNTGEKADEAMHLNEDFAIDLDMFDSYAASASA